MAYKTSNSTKSFKACHHRRIFSVICMHSCSVVREHARHVSVVSYSNESSGMKHWLHAWQPTFFNKTGSILILPTPDPLSACRAQHAFSQVQILMVLITTRGFRASKVMLFKLPKWVSESAHSVPLKLKAASHCCNRHARTQQLIKRVPEQGENAHCFAKVVDKVAGGQYVHCR